MPDPVKTSLLKAITTALEGITVDGVTLLGTVIRNPSKPIDRETAKFPLVFIYDESEEIINRNRLAMVTMPLQIEVWLKEHELSVSDQADIVEAEIHKALCTDTQVLYWSMDIRPDPANSATKFYDDEFIGGTILRYIVKFAYAWGDPYDPVKA
jgi:hypothetical protein